MMFNRFQQLSLVLVAVLAALTSAFTPVLIPSSRAASATQYTLMTTSSMMRETSYRSIPSSAVVRLQAAGPATLEPEVIEKEDIKEEETTKSESTYKRGGWAVRLFNDPMNKREFVAMCLSKITGLSDGQAYQVMMQAHQNGVSVVGRYDQERAELYRDSLVEHGLVVDMIPVEDD